VLAPALATLAARDLPLHQPGIRWRRQQHASQ
jgi:hypothetical protein